MKKLTLLLLLSAVLAAKAQHPQAPLTDEQLDILGLQADVQKCQVEAQKVIRKLQKELAEAKKATGN